MSRLATIIFVLFAALLFTGSAPPPEGEYSLEAWTGCSSGYNSGQWDNAGNLFIPCGSPSTIRVYDSNGTLTQTFAAGFSVKDVAPSRDGQYVYVSGSAAPKRFSKQPNGSYTLDTGWSLSTYPMYGKQWAPKGYFITVDGNGDIYLADGAWGGNGTHTVVKYSPDGSFITRFGEYSQTWELGTFYWMLTGIAVTPDGSRVYTAEVGNNRVQLWDRQLDGSYAVSGSWGGTEANNADRGGYCDFNAWYGAFAAPYDVSLDAAGNVYVINTTCKQILKFDASGTYITGIDVRLNGGDYPRPHGFAVSARGDVYVGENQKLAKYNTATPLPIDTIAPQLDSVTIPSTTTTSTVTVSITATDNVSVTQVRLANEDGNWGAWKVFSPTMQHLLSSGIGKKGVFVQVRDAANNESGTVFTKTRVIASVVDSSAPVLNSVSVPVETVVQSILIGISATDDVAVAEVRLANEDGNWGSWQPFSSTVQHQLSSGLGIKGIFVQVRDSSGKASNIVFVKTRLIAG